MPHDRHGPTHPTAGQAGHWAAQTMAYQPQYCQQHNNHTRRCPETRHNAKQHPGRETSDVWTTTATKHGQPGPYGPPHNTDGPTTGKPTPANQHHAPGTPRSQHIHRTGQAGRRNPQNKRGRQQKQRRVHPCRLHNRLQTKLLQNNDPTLNRPHASRPTPNRPGMQELKRERRFMGWRQHAAPRPPTTIPTNTTEHRNSTITNPTNQR